MTTQKQIQANRANAKSSTGPRSDDGKKKSSRNAVTHGLTARFPLLADEDPKQFAELLQTLVREFVPISMYDRLQIERLAGYFWCAARCAHFEVEILSLARSEIRRGIASKKAKKTALQEVGLGDPLKRFAASEICQILKGAAEAAESEVDQAEDTWGGAFQYDVNKGDALSKLGRHEVRIRNAIEKLIAHLDERRASRTSEARPYDEWERRTYGLDKEEPQEPV